MTTGALRNGPTRVWIATATTATTTRPRQLHWASRSSQIGTDRVPASPDGPLPSTLATVGAKAIAVTATGTARNSPAIPNTAAAAGTTTRTRAGWTRGARPYTNRAIAQRRTAAVIAMSSSEANAVTTPPAANAMTTTTMVVKNAPT